jgi:hypothetical protein
LHFLHFISFLWGVSVFHRPAFTAAVVAAVVVTDPPPGPVKIHLRRLDPQLALRVEDLQNPPSPLPPHIRLLHGLTSTQVVSILGATYHGPKKVVKKKMHFGEKNKRQQYQSHIPKR